MNPYLVFLNHLTVRSAWKPTQFSLVGSLVHHYFSYPLCNQNDFCCARPKANSFTITYIKWMLCLCTFLYRLIVRNVYKWTGIDMGYRWLHDIFQYDMTMPESDHSNKTDIQRAYKSSILPHLCSFLAVSSYSTPYNISKFHFYQKCIGCTLSFLNRKCLTTAVFWFPLDKIGSEITIFDKTV